MPVFINTSYVRFVSSSVDCGGLHPAFVDGSSGALALPCAVVSILAVLCVSVDLCVVYSCI